MLPPACKLMPFPHVDYAAIICNSPGNGRTDKRIAHRISDDCAREIPMRYSQMRPHNRLLPKIICPFDSSNIAVQEDNGPCCNVKETE